MQFSRTKKLFVNIKLSTTNFHHLSSQIFGLTCRFKSDRVEASHRVMYPESTTVEHPKSPREDVLPFILGVLETWWQIDRSSQVLI